MSKLQVLLLLEANLNWLYKIIFSGYLLPSLEHRNEIPHEIIGGRRGQLAYYIALNKILISDNRNIRKKPTIIISTDAANWFDRMVHYFALLVYYHFGLQIEYIIILFLSIQSIKMYL